MPQPNPSFPKTIYSYHFYSIAAKKWSIKHYSLSSINSIFIALFTVGLSTGVLTGCSDLSAQTPSNIPPANTAIRTQPMETTQNTLSEQPPEQRSIWVTMANMRCH